MLGVGARRVCDDIVRSGRVRVGGKVTLEPGTKVVPDRDKVTLDGVPLHRPPRPLVLLLNKPEGVVSTVSDPQGRPTVLDLCRRYAKNRRLFPVGRLDFNTTGAILLTNDGMLCYRLTHPRFEVPKTYQVRVRGSVTPRRLAMLQKLASGQRQRSGSSDPVDVIKELRKESVIRITLYEGRNRQVRKMCQAVGLQVVKLKRVRFGPISIRKLPLGAVRPLEPKEVKSLERLLQQDVEGERSGDGPGQAR